MFIREGTPSGLSTMSQRRAVGQEGHVLLGQDAGDNALVAVAAGHLVAHGDLSLLGDVDAHQLVDARRRARRLFSRVKTLTSTMMPHSPCGTRREVSRTSRAFSPKIARSRRSSAVSSVSPLGVTLPTRMSPARTSAPMRMMPRSSRSRRASSPTLGMSRVISSGPSLVSRASDLVLLHVDGGVDVVLDQPLGEQDGVLVVVALPGHKGRSARCLPRAISPWSVEGPSAMTWPFSTRSPAHARWAAG